jgi:CubicO group peptidase (beta-lactamase class C family)
MVSGAQADVYAPIEALRQQYKVPALAVLQLKEHQPVNSAFTGFRKQGDPTPVQSTDQFHLGSCTKAMTATLIAMLIEEGKLQWTSTLGSLFPEIAMDPAYSQVTIEMLGAHRAGLPASMQDRALWASLWTDSMSPQEERQKMIQSVLALPPVSTPSSQYLYSNLGYVIFGAIIDRLTNSTWESFIQKRLFDPLQMKSCGFGAAGNPNASSPDEPWGHVMADGVMTPVAPDLHGDNPPGMNSAGRVHCSLADWGKFLQMHADGFNGKTGLLLKPETFAKLQTSYPGQKYTYGGWIRDTRAWAGGTVLTHEGTNTFSKAVVWMAPLKNEIFMSATNFGGDGSSNVLDAAISYLITH